MLAGRVNVRAMTWRKRMPMMPNQMKPPEAGSGAGDQDGNMER